ncbi:hypothetical protein C8Q75DRAFT_735832 [Abortiporus biennis]|nr:hypothetical protein C8Q75DRAFT_735832 [Abortiporus biennis]
MFLHSYIPTVADHFEYPLLDFPRRLTHNSSGNLAEKPRATWTPFEFLLRPLESLNIVQIWFLTVASEETKEERNSCQLSANPNHFPPIYRWQPEKESLESTVQSAQPGTREDDLLAWVLGSLQNAIWGMFFDGGIPQLQSPTGCGIRGNNHSPSTPHGSFRSKFKKRDLSFGSLIDSIDKDTLTGHQSDPVQVFSQVLLFYAMVFKVFKCCRFGYYATFEIYLFTRQSQSKFRNSFKLKYMNRDMKYICPRLRVLECQTVKPWLLYLTQVRSEDLHVDVVVHHKDMRPRFACTPDDTDTTGSSLFLTAQDSFSRVLCNPPLEIFRIRAIVTGDPTVFRRMQELKVPTDSDVDGLPNIREVFLKIETPKITVKLRNTLTI